MERSFILTVGCPGSGKSTLADKLCQADPGILRLERDRVRETFFGSRQAYHQHPSPISLRSALIGSCMAKAMDVALDLRTHHSVIMSDTCIHWDSVKRFWERAQDRRLRPVIYVFDVSWNVLHERNLTRPEAERVPWDVLDNFHKALRADDAWWRAKPHTLLNEMGEPKCES